MGYAEQCAQVEELAYKSRLCDKLIDAVAEFIAEVDRTNGLKELDELVAQTVSDFKKTLGIK